MSSSGSPETEPRATRRLPLVTLIILAAVTIPAIIVGFNLLRVIYGVIMPPLPPLPPSVTQVSHESEAYGVDKWRYTSAASPCELAEYYLSIGASCNIAPMQCGSTVDAETYGLDTSLVARCRGGDDFSIFHSQWAAEVVRDNTSPDTPAILQLEREVYWIGTGPQ